MSLIDHSLESQTVVPRTEEPLMESSMKEITETIAPFCYGYLTQYWFGIDGPMPNKPTLEIVNHHRAVAFSQDIGSGICAYILQNGLVKFNFEKYKGDGVIIYRYEKSSNGESRRISGANLEGREREAQENAFRLVQIHAVLLDNARRLHEGCASYTARPTSIGDMHKGYDVADPLRTLDPVFKYWQPLPDRVAKKSLEDLSKIFLNTEGLFQLVEIYSFSLTHFLERRYSEALILYWAAIEALINVLWDRLLAAEKEASDVGLSKQRRDRLKSPNSFTASVMIESLYLLRRIPYEVYEGLNEIRKKRNDWMHKLQPIDHRVALEARNVCEHLLRHVFAFDLKGTIGGVGGCGGDMYRDVFCRRYPHKAGLFEASADENGFLPPENKRG